MLALAVAFRIGLSIDAACGGLLLDSLAAVASPALSEPTMAGDVVPCGTVSLSRRGVVDANTEAVAALPADGKAGGSFSEREAELLGVDGEVLALADRLELSGLGIRAGEVGARVEKGEGMLLGVDKEALALVELSGLRIGDSVERGEVILLGVDKEALALALAKLSGLRIVAGVERGEVMLLGVDKEALALVDELELSGLGVEGEVLGWAAGKNGKLNPPTAVVSRGTVKGN